MSLPVAFGARRQCTRTACTDPAVVTLTYDYRTSQAWLDVLSAERDPHGYDLCRRHAVTLTVPLGWHLVDRQPVARGELLAG
jgi:Protein of unknown function (DUF3499)